MFNLSASCVQCAYVPSSDDPFLLYLKCLLSSFSLRAQRSDGRRMLILVHQLQSLYGTLTGGALRRGVAEGQQRCLNAFAVAL